MSIEKSTYLKKFDSHTNEKRTIIGLLNSPEKSPIKIEQIRTITTHQDCELGNHYRDYGEIYSTIGQATFTLEDIESKERKTHLLETGDQLYIPPKVAIKVEAKRGIIIICCSEKYDRENGTHKYNIE